MSERQRGIFKFTARTRSSRASAHASRVLILAFSLFALVSNPAPSLSGTTVSTDTRDGRLLIFDDVWRTVAERYYDASMRGVDWSAERALFRPLAADAQTRTEFYTTLRRMIATLRDAHTRVYAPDERADWDRPAFVGVGVSLREIEDQIVVARVTRGSEAERAGVRAGDDLLRVDGKPVGELIARRAADGVVASTDAASRLTAIAHLFDGARDSFVTLDLADARGRERSVRLRRTLETREPQLDVRRVGKIAVVRFDLFTQEIATEFVRALGGEDTRGAASGLRGARALVIDLRGNGGGESEAMIDAASAFLPAGTPLGAFTDRAGRTISAPQTRRAMLFAADAIKNFRGAVVVLTGTRTASAAEIFVAALRDAGRAHVIGERTCGCVLAIRERHALADGGALDVSELDYRTARGARLEGVGLMPDETVTPTRRDIEAGRDPVLLRAITLLKRMKDEG